MAKEDYNVADRTIESLTAGEVVQETVFENPDTDAAAFADTEGVAIAAYANYATALEAHESREDIETLADRRAREYGADYDAGEFMRAPHGNTPPTSGSVDGVAPASA